jgi:GNAT superfamily N-acetyltransferase
LIIRLAEEDDLPELAGIQLDADSRYAETDHPEDASTDAIPLDHARRAVADGRLIVAEVEGHVAGWAFLAGSEGELLIGHICVSTRHARRGIGKALMEFIEDFAIARGLPSIVLNTYADVPWNAPWYERLGFAVVPEAEWNADMRAIAEEQAEDGEDWGRRVHMRKQLPKKLRED